MYQELLRKSAERCYRQLWRAGYLLNWQDEGTLVASLVCAGITVRQVVMTVSAAGRVTAVAVHEG